jgi:hypothetical protein
MSQLAADIIHASPQEIPMRDALVIAKALRSYGWKKANRSEEDVAELHAKRAKQLMASARGWQIAANDPDAAGSDIRAGWADHAARLMAEAQVEASLAAAKRGQA